MDFSYLLELAKENDKNNKHEAKVPKFSTKVSGAKRLQKASPNVDAIKALLDKKDENKAIAEEEFKKKRANLLALRAQDKRANKRVSAMINRTKGASKSVLEDAKDLTTARGEEQCDEDDYGYESAMSQQIFSKLADQYAKMPDDDKLKFVKTGKKTSIDDIKNRVINSLKKEEEEEMEPRKRKRKSKYADDGFINDGDAFDDFDEPADTTKKNSVSSSQKTVNINYTNYKSDRYNNFKYEVEKEVAKSKEKKEKKKPKPSAPPPLSFVELMQMAQKKQSAPVEKLSAESIIKEKEKEKKKDIDRPLTAKEKEELEDERRRKARRLSKLAMEGKKEDASDKTRKNGADKGKKIEDKVKGKSENASKLQQALEKPKPEPKVPDRAKFFAVPGVPKQQPVKKVDKPMISAPKNPPVPVKNKPPPPSEHTSDRKFQKPRDFPPKDLKPVKPRDFQQRQKSRDLPPLDRRRPQYAPPPPKRGRIESDSEDEYDSDLEDFIDDGEDELDYSSEIKRMFGYDKSRYVDEDDDCDDMEASYSQLQKEERISAKIGLQEDLEDMKREEEEKKLKRLKMKGKGRR